MTSERTSPTLMALLAVLSGCVADSGDETVSLTPVENWTTEVEYEFGDVFQGDALFAGIADVDVSPDGSRVYVVDYRASEVTIWTPDGTPVHRFGQEGEGPADFLDPGDLTFRGDALIVGDERGFATFSLDGVFIRRDMVPPGINWRGSLFFQYEALLDDGSFLATPSIGAVTGDDLMDEIPLLRISREGETWVLDTVALEDHRNTEIAFAAGAMYTVFLTQKWVRPDVCRGDGSTSSVVCSRTRAMPPGVVEFIEISVAGDTVWTRRIQLPPIAIEDQEIAAEVERMASVLARSSGGDSITSPSRKRKARELLIVPDFWPATGGIRLMPNGEVWFRRLKGGAEHVWYAAARGATEGPVRRIVLPERFKPRGVNGTHVWGDRDDEMGVDFVVGLRLVRGGG